MVRSREGGEGEEVEVEVEEEEEEEESIYYLIIRQRRQTVFGIAPRHCRGEPRSRKRLGHTTACAPAAWGTRSGLSKSISLAEVGVCQSQSGVGCTCLGH